MYPHERIVYASRTEVDPLCPELPVTAAVVSALEVEIQVIAAQRRIVLIPPVIVMSPRPDLDETCPVIRAGCPIGVPVAPAHVPALFVFSLPIVLLDVVIYRHAQVVAVKSASVIRTAGRGREAARRRQKLLIEVIPVDEVGEFIQGSLHLEAILGDLILIAEDGL